MLEPLTGAYRALKFEVWWARNRSEVLSKALMPPSSKAAETSFSTVVSTDWYQRQGYSRLANALGGGRGSYAGKTITEDVAFEVSAFYAGIKVISEDMGNLPFFLYRKRVDGGADPAANHPLFPILHDLANPELSAGEWVEMMTAHSIFGDAYSRIERDRDRKIVWIYPFMPGEIRTDRNQLGQMFYVHTPKGGGDKTYTRDDVFHLRGYTLTGEHGDDLLSRARHVLGLAAVSQEYASKYFANSASPDIVVQFPANMLSGRDSVQTFKDAWKKWHQGPNRWHEPAVVQGGEVKVLDRDHQKAQLLELRTFQILEVCRLLRLQPAKLAEYGRATWANAEQQQIDYTAYSLGSPRRRWRQAVHRCLLTRDEQVEGLLYAEHSVEALQRGDFTAQTTGFARLLQAGVYSINDVRRWLNMNPVPGGDEHFIQINMAPVSQAAELAQAQIDAARGEGDGQQEEVPQPAKVMPIRRMGHGN
jgi:HK97 family phage portal protein